MPRPRRTVGLTAVAAMIVPALALGVPFATGVEEPGETPAAAGVQAPPPSPLGELDEATYEITLITGDTVSIERVGPATSANGGYSVATEPTRRPDGTLPQIEVTNMGEGDALYALPTDVGPYVEAGLLDSTLFDVAYLAENGYADRDALPLVVQYAENQNANDLSRRAADLTATTGSVPLDSIDAVAVGVERDQAASFWHSLTGDGTSGRLADGIERIWLDPAVSIALDESVPQVGAPEAWAAGLDGAGTTVAVLDTGVDATHPDVADRIVASRSFIQDQEVADGHGHGTHVASTIAGSGAASEGRFTGVAPGADLVIGKVLADDGASFASAVIAGMEWAALEQDADVVSMSLGGQPTDGTDPLSQAVNALTAQADAIFVVAAGNSGMDATIATPGAADMALTVGAVDRDDQVASFSSRGPRLGDYAIKPEITAPGVSIGAARAAGTSMPGAVHIDERYTRVSGTSMATPHVAGAAAILAQQHPDWSAEQLRAALVASAADQGQPAYHQGAGRLDVPRAIGQSVHVSPATVNLGFHQLPVDEEPVTRVLTYTNPTDAPITLALEVSLRADDGDAAPADAVSLDHDSVSLPVGGSATATVTFDRAAVDPGAYTGAVVASASDLGVRMTTPLGAVIGEPVHTVTVRQLHSDDPAGWHADAVILAPIAGPAARSGQAGWVIRGAGNDVILAEEWAAGVDYTLAEGTYIAFTSTSATWYDDERGGNHNATLLDLEVEVPGDTEIVLDAAQAEKVTFDTPKPTEGLQRRHLLQRWVPDHVAGGGGFVTLASVPSDTNGRGDYWITPTDQARTGEFRMVVEETRVAPTLSMRVEDHDDLALYPQYANLGSDFATLVLPPISVSEPTVEGLPAEAPPGPVVRTGDAVDVAVEVANPSDAPTRTGLTVTSTFGPGTCADATLEGGQSTTCTVRGTAADGPHLVPVTVTASGTAGVAVAHYTGAADPTTPPPPSEAALTVSAPTVSGSRATGAGAEVEAGSVIIVQVTVRNTGTAELTGVSGGSELGDLSCARTRLLPGEQTTCTITATAGEGAQTLMIMVTGHDPAGVPTAAAVLAYYTGMAPVAMFDGNRALDVVDAGYGTPADLADLDVEGAMVLLRADPAAFDQRKAGCWPDQEALLGVVAAGAAAVLVAPNEEHRFFDRPISDLHGSLWCKVAPRLDASEARAIAAVADQVPVVFLPHDQATALQELAAAGQPRIEVDGTPVTPYVYQLRAAMDGAVPESLDFTVDADELVTIDHHIHASVPVPYGFSMTAWRPTDAAIGPRMQHTRALPPLATTGPREVTEYSWPLDSDTIIRHEVEDFTSLAGRQVRYDVFDEPAHVSMTWNDSPPVPAPAPPAAGYAPDGYLTHGMFPVEMAPCTGCSEDGLFWPHLRYTASSDPGQIGWSFVNLIGQLGNDRNTRLFRDGEEITGGPDPIGQTLLTFPLADGPADYRLTHHLGATETAWAFTAGAGTEVSAPYICDSDWMAKLLELPPSDAPCHVEPLIFLRYDLGLDLDNTVPAPGPQQVTVTTHRQPSAQPAPDIEGLRLWVSYDGGEEWDEARVRPGDAGTFDARIMHRPANRRASDVVTIRAEAWDEAGNRIEQTMRGAYRLTNRNADDRR